MENVLIEILVCALTLLVSLAGVAITAHWQRRVLPPDTRRLARAWQKMFQVGVYSTIAAAFVLPLLSALSTGP